MITLNEITIELTREEHQTMIIVDADESESHPYIICLIK
jgi:hypothetical protein